MSTGSTDASLEEIIVVILAAGQSSRMGRLKQLLPYNGVALLQRAVDSATSFSFSSVAIRPLVILGASATEIKSTINFANCAVEINDDWQSGLASSVKCALNFIGKNFTSCRGILLTLADQPHVTAKRMAEIIERQVATNSPIVVSSFSVVNQDGSVRTIPGPPAFFAREIFAELMQLQGDKGAREVVLADPRRVATIDFPLAAVDIDSQADYLKLVGA